LASLNLKKVRKRMTYQLYIGDRTFSSWSLRGWLMLEKFELPYKTTMVGLYGGTMAAEMAHLTPAKTVPAMQTPAGHILTDSLAMAETLVEAHPETNLYPRDTAARALARSMVAEMHGSFAALREDCPNNMSNTWIGFVPSDAVKRDVARIELLWELARHRHGAGGPWLFGNYSLADVFYAPIVCRMVTYGLEVGPIARAYIDLMLAETSLRQWRAMGQTVTYDPFPYEMALEKAVWPIPNLITAKPVESGDPENNVCPYSGLEITHRLETGGRIFGFCNAFCRDKTEADPAAWPKFMALL